MSNTESEMSNFHLSRIVQYTKNNILMRISGETTRLSMESVGKDLGGIYGKIKEIAKRKAVTKLIQ